MKEKIISVFKAIVFILIVFSVIFGILLYFSTEDARAVAKAEKDLYIEVTGSDKGYNGEPCATKEDMKTKIYKQYTNEELGDVMGTMCIPDSGAAAILQSSTRGETIDTGVTHTIESNPPTFGENTVLAGHRHTYFANLYTLEIGEQILLNVGENSYVYEVVEAREFQPTEVDYVYMTNEDIPANESYLTLYTCYPKEYLSYITGRYAVRLKLVE